LVRARGKHATLRLLQMRARVGQAAKNSVNDEEELP
jgi:hypothetical protein